MFEKRKKIITLGFESLDNVTLNFIPRVKNIVDIVDFIKRDEPIFILTTSEKTFEHIIDAYSDFFYKELKDKKTYTISSDIIEPFDEIVVYDFKFKLFIKLTKY